MGRYATLVHWRDSWHQVAVCGLVACPLILLFAFRLMSNPLDRSVHDSLILWTWLTVIIGSITGMLWISRKLPKTERSVIAFFGLGVMLFGLTFQSGWRVTYLSGDVPTEMMVYTQTSPDVRRIAKEIEHIAVSTGDRFDMPIIVDSEGGFSWPWAWYLRDYRVSYPNLSDHKSEVELDDAAVLIVNAVNNSGIEDSLAEDFVIGERFQHRSWFPESYRGMNWVKGDNNLLNSSVWQSVSRYWLLRELEAPLGSADGYVYYSNAVRTETIAPSTER